MPKNKKDEELFKETALALGWKDVIFLYPDKKNDVVLASQTQISSLKSTKLVFSEASRSAIERGAHVLFNFENDAREDFLHHRASGLNHVLCKLMQDKGSFMAFNFNNILNSDDIFCSKILGRIQQNISLCRKFKVPMIVFSFAKTPFEMRSPQDLRSFFLDLGIHPKEFSDGFFHFSDLLDKVRKKG